MAKALRFRSLTPTVRAIVDTVDHVMVLDTSTSVTVKIKNERGDRIKCTLTYDRDTSSWKCHGIKTRVQGERVSSIFKKWLGVYARHLRVD